jgi:cyclic pyranopterin phosphate synthase
MPEDGVPLASHHDILSLEEIYQAVNVAISMGVEKVRLTGGEPLVRKGIVDLVKMISSINGIKDLAMTTNGFYLEKYAQQLKSAGLHRVNISLDSMYADEFKKITRLGDLEKVKSGIAAAEKAGLTPIKINCVIKKSKNEKDAKSVAKFCADNGYQIKVQGGEGGNCKSCNRLRLTAKGDIMPCLFSDFGFNIKELGIENAFNLALGNKPKSGSVNTKNKFSNIGG